MTTIIDRRLNPGGKSLPNRQKFIERAKTAIKKAVAKDVRDMNIRDIGKSERGVSIPIDDLREPSYGFTNTAGKDDYVLPGNEEYLPGDGIERPRRPPPGSPVDSGDDQDAFRFVLSREEYLNLFLEDLELPNMTKRKLSAENSTLRVRAGYTVDGSPMNISLGRTMRNSLMRRIALGRPRPDDLEEKEGETPEEEEARIALKSKVMRIPYIDPMDVRYRRFENRPMPKTKAVMFCLMDVSGSMSDKMKDVAKRFYTLLHLFLERYYEHTEVVFIRHTTDAAVVDEDTFFYSMATGGTIVSSALKVMLEEVRARYSPEEWNIYVAQATDGDNYPSDNHVTADMVKNQIMPVVQYFAYLEVMSPFVDPSSAMKSSLWNTYDTLNLPPTRFAMKQVREARDIYPVFRELFEKKD